MSGGFDEAEQQGAGHDSGSAAAHAAVCGYRLLTRDGNRYRTYFPKLALISPDS